MNQLLKPGRLIFAIGIAGLAILSFISKDFILGRPPAWPAALNFNPALAYISAAILIVCAVAIIISKKAFSAALIIAILILILSLFRHIPAFMNDWLNTYKTLALTGGALIVAASFTNLQKVRSRFIFIGTITLSIFFIASGYAHFKFADFVTDFIPSYIPFRMFFAYFCGVCLIAGGVGILIPPTAKLAAMLSGIMLLGWFLFLHIVRVMANAGDPGERMGLFESFTFAGIFFTLAALISLRNNSSKQVN